MSHHHHDDHTNGWRQHGRRHGGGIPGDYDDGPIDGVAWDHIPEGAEPIDIDDWMRMQREDAEKACSSARDLDTLRRYGHLDGMPRDPEGREAWRRGIESHASVIGPEGPMFVCPFANIMPPVPPAPPAPPARGAYEDLRAARNGFLEMCGAVADETERSVRLAFLPCPFDQGDDAPGIDWRLTVGSSRHVLGRIDGTYEELVDMWRKGAGTFHEWVLGMVIDGCSLRSGAVANHASGQDDATRSVSGVVLLIGELEKLAKDYGKGAPDAEQGGALNGADGIRPADGDKDNMPKAKVAADATASDDEGDGGDDEGDGGDDGQGHEDMVDHAKVALAACGYVVSPAHLPDYLRFADFLAWHGEDPVLIEVCHATDREVALESGHIRADVATLLAENARMPRSLTGMIVTVDGDHVAIGAESLS